jgi:hypothetical protein
MPKRKIGHLEHHNELTGEITVSRSVWTNKYTESFIMLRTTDGLDWFYDLGKNEKSLVIMLHNWSEPTNMRVSLAGWQREEVCKKLCINRRQISLVLKRLVERDCIKRINQNDFMVNPAHAFKCSASQVRDRIEIYKQLKTK